MKYVFASWAVPMIVFWGWYFLSLNDMNFGYVMLSRQVNDLFFRMYGDVLGIDPAALPPMVARTCVFDGLMLCALWAFRRRRELSIWVRANYIRYFAVDSEPSA